MFVLILILLVLHITMGCSAIKFVVDPQPVVEFNQHDYEDPDKIVGGKAQLYVPDRSEVDSDGDLKLLLSYAPVIVQGTQPGGKEKYEPEADMIGHPEVQVESRKDDKKHSLTINTQRPTLFYRIEKTLVKGTELTQLVYVYWYPRHPIGGIQKGHIDGGVLRVTVDAGGRPAIYEHTLTCGCYHGVFVGEHVEAWASKSFDQLEEDKRYFVERRVKGFIDWVVRDIVRGTQTKARPVLFLEVGTHRCAAIQTVRVSKRWNNLPKKTYQLKRYENLEHLPVQGREDESASMFNEDGLVWGGRRLGEEFVFFTMDHPGWPRHLDKVKMHWDEVDWIDPALLETHLRLPEQIVDESADLVSLDEKVRMGLLSQYHRGEHHRLK